ncbi:MAG: hypothetical protein J0L75_06395 [Spirochaetes bacterium]|nr:hypothetical protein [Spirochaetota bacterium]
MAKKITACALLLILGAPLYSVNATWLSNGFLTRIPITVRGALVVGTLTNYPALIALSGDTNLSNAAHPQGFDLVFTGGDGTTVLPHEIEAYTNGTLSAWVKIPLLQAGVDTTLYLYASNTAIAASLENRAGVWDTHFVGVWHMKNQGLYNYDSTANSNHGTNIGTLSTNTNGITATAVQFDGATSYIELGNPGTIRSNTNDSTVEMWVIPARTNNRVSPLGKSYGGEFSMAYENNGTVTFYYGQAGLDNNPYTSMSIPVLETNAWVYAAFVRQFSASKQFAYRHSLLSRSTASSTPGLSSASSSALPMRIGRGYAGYWHGSIDEVRISSIARPSNYVATTYTNLMFWSNFTSAGSPWSFRTVVAAITNLTNQSALVQGGVLRGSHYSAGGIRETRLVASNTATAAVDTYAVSPVGAEDWQVAPALPIGRYVVWVATTNSNLDGTNSAAFSISVNTASRVTVRTVDSTGAPWAGGRVLGPSPTVSAAQGARTNDSAGEAVFTDLYSGTLYAFSNFTPSFWGAALAYTNFTIPITSTNASLVIVWTLDRPSNSLTLSGYVEPTVFIPSRSAQLSLSIPQATNATRHVVLTATALSGGRKLRLYDGMVSPASPFVQITSETLRQGMSTGTWILEFQFPSLGVDHGATPTMRRMLFFAQ